VKSIKCSLQILLWVWQKFLVICMQYCI